MFTISIHNTEILKNQYRLYKIFNIYDISNKFESSDVGEIADITTHDYAKFIYALNELSISYIKQLKENKFIEIEEMLPNELEELLIVEKVIKKRPHNFYIFIDYINKFEYEKINLKEDKLMSWNFSPLSFLYKPYYSIDITRIPTISKYIHYYFCMRYNYETFHNRTYAVDVK